MDKSTRKVAHKLGEYYAEDPWAWHDLCGWYGLVWLGACSLYVENGKRIGSCRIIYHVNGSNVFFSSEYHNYNYYLYLIVIHI